MIEEGELDAGDEVDFHSQSIAPLHDDTPIHSEFNDANGEANDVNVSKFDSPQSKVKDKSWRNLYRGNHNSSYGLSLEFIQNSCNSVN